MDMHLPSIVATPERVAELDRLGDDIAELSAHVEAATARLLALIREFDARGGWNGGFRSCADWLSWRVGLDLGAARERVRVARALGTLPRLAGALACGELSYAKVRALSRVATAETEERLLAVGRAGTAAHVERIVRGWRWVDRKAEARETARQHARRALHVYQDEDGTVVVRGRLEPEVGALFLKALAAARETLYQRARREEPGRASAGKAAAAPMTETPSTENPERDVPTPGSAARRRPGSAGGDGPARARPRRSGRALPGGGPRRCRSAGRPRSARPVRPRGGGASFRGNFAAARVRREPGGDAP